MGSETITEAPRDRTKAVAIAQDVIQHLDKLRVAQGTYCYGPVPGFLDMTGDLRDHLPIFVEHCKVCALGACFLSQVRLFNSFPIWRAYGRESYAGVHYVEMTKELEKAFGWETLKRIEAEFEGYAVYGTAPVHFYQQYSDPRSRLRGIMENIIANDGDFLPGKENASRE